jgi:hypothetical protein
MQAFTPVVSRGGNEEDPPLSAAFKRLLQMGVRFGGSDLLPRADIDNRDVLLQSKLDRPSKIEL